jgi:YjbE family integral membrane protein
MDTLFWVNLGKIIWIDILLSGDNALVIALACHALPARQRFWGMILGAAGAVVLRIVLTGMATRLLELPYLKLIGGAVLLFYIAPKMLVPDDGDGEGKSPDRLWSAVRTIVAADIVMSIDNVLAVAVAAQGSLLLLAIALALSIPFVVGGATIISAFLNKFPLLIWLGAGLLGWIGGETIVSDPLVENYVRNNLLLFNESWFYAGLGVCIVLGIGAIWRSHAMELTDG